MSKARIISDFLIALSRRVERLTDEELEGLLEDVNLDRLLRERNKSSRKRRVVTGDVRSKAEALMQELTLKISREEAIEFLDELSPSKDVLTEAANMRELHILKQDTLKTISEKLVENVVGSRLDSARIRGTQDRKP